MDHTCDLHKRDMWQQVTPICSLLCKAQPKSILKMILVESRRSWSLVREESKFIDWQKVKVQEKSDEVCAMTVDVVKLQCGPAVDYHLYPMLGHY